MNELIKFSQAITFSRERTAKNEPKATDANVENELVSYLKISVILSLKTIHDCVISEHRIT